MIYVIGIAVLLAVVALGRRFGFLRPSTALSEDIHAWLPVFLAGVVFMMVLPDDARPLFDRTRGQLLMFCLSWIGFYYGCGLELRASRKFPDAVIVFNLCEPVIVFTGIAVVGTLVLWLHFDTWLHTPIALLAAVFSSVTLFRRKGILVRDDVAGHHPLLDNLLPIGNLFPIAALGILAITLFGPETLSIAGVDVTGGVTKFLWCSVFGIACGMLINMLASEAPDGDSLGLILVAGVALAGGIAYHFSFSPLYLGAVSGAFVINSTLKRLELLASLNVVNGIVEVLYLFFFGATVATIAPLTSGVMLPVIAAALTLVILRGALMFGIGYIWAGRLHNAQGTPAILWMGLVGQGMVASAVAVECAIHADLTPSVFVFLVSVLVVNQVVIGVFLARTAHTTLADTSRDI